MKRLFLLLSCALVLSGLGHSQSLPNGLGCLRPSGGFVPMSYQTGSAGAPFNRTISTQINAPIAAGDEGSATEGQAIRVGDANNGLIAWPDFLGNATGQVKPKKVISQGKVRLEILSSSVATGMATINLERILATGCEPPWDEPDQDGVDQQGVSVTWKTRAESGGPGVTSIDWAQAGGDTVSGEINPMVINLANLPMTIEFNAKTALQEMIRRRSNHGFLVDGQRSWRRLYRVCVR